MPIQLYVCERRDNADRNGLGNAAMDWCRAIRKRDGISSSRFYWYGPDTLVIITEGEAEALNAPARDADTAKAGFALSDLARLTINWQLVDPGAGEETYRRAGR